MASRPTEEMKQPGSEVGHRRVGSLMRENAIALKRNTRCCQTNSNSSQFSATGVNLPGKKLTSLGESGGAVQLEI